MATVPMRLLVVDEAEDWRRTLARHFTARGWEVTVAAGALEALAQTFVRPPDAIIVNTSLSSLEGYETAAILRRIRPGTPIILTTDADADARPHSTERRECFPCFQKPLDLDDLAHAVEEVGRVERGGLP